MPLPDLRALHGSGGIRTAVHCFRIVFSMGLRSGGMRFCMAAREPEAAVWGCGKARTFVLAERIRNHE
jgi:hypothetical protein